MLRVSRNSGNGHYGRVRAGKAGDGNNTQGPRRQLRMMARRWYGPPLVFLHGAKGPAVADGCRCSTLLAQAVRGLRSGASGASGCPTIRPGAATSANSREFVYRRFPRRARPYQVNLVGQSARRWAAVRGRVRKRRVAGTLSLLGPAGHSGCEGHCERRSTSSGMPRESVRQSLPRPVDSPTHVGRCRQRIEQAD